MSAAPWMPLYVADYLGDTQHLTTEQHGAYLLLLMAMWRAGGALPADPAQLARIARLSPPRWRKLSPEVLAFFDAGGAELTQKRLRREIEKVSEVSRKRALAGARGGVATAMKRSDDPPAFAMPMPDGLPDHHQSPEPDSTTPDADGNPDSVLNRIALVDDMLIFFFNRH